MTVRRKMREQGPGDVPVVVGGIILSATALHLAWWRTATSVSRELVEVLESQITSAVRRQWWAVGGGGRARWRRLPFLRATPVVRLTEVFRQAAKSRIITNAHRINQGLMPEPGHEPASDFHLVRCQGPEDGVVKLLEIVARRMSISDRTSCPGRPRRPRVAPSG